MKTKFDPFVLCLSLGIIMLISGIVVVAKTATMPLFLGLLATILGGGLVWFALTKIYNK